MEVDLFDESGTAVVHLNKKERAKVQELERVIDFLRRKHGNGESCTHPDDGHLVPDSEFDAYVKHLTDLDPSSKVLQGAMSAADFDPNAKKIKHDPPMTSIKKANGSLSDKQAELDKFVQAYATEMNITVDDARKKLVVSYKHDGVACSLVYKDGDLIEAGLRPREGVYGEDITENVKFVQGVPAKLPLPLTCVIRGELECRISVFNSINGTAVVENQEFANARNYTTGSIRQYKDPTKTQSRQISFVAYSILGLDKPPFKTERERAIWCNKELKIPFVRTEFMTDNVLAELEAKVPSLDYEVDGAVISIDDLEEQEQMGVHGSATNAIPKGKLAWKFADETADPVITEIAWYTGRTGQIVPVCNFDGVRLAGTTVQKAAAHSIGFLVRNNIHIGSKIRIRKSGKIIPQVLGRMDGVTFVPTIDGGDPKLPAKFDLDKFIYPKKCPSCQHDTTVEEGQKHGLLELRCDNNDCAARNIKRFVHYLEKFGVKGIGEATITRWVEAGLVSKFSDFYELSVKKLVDEGETPRQSLLAVAAIHMVVNPEQVKDNKVLAAQVIDAMKRKKPVSLAKFISCLGIKGASRGTGTAISGHFGTFQAILDAKEDDFLQAPDVGDKTAKSLAEFFAEHKNDLIALTQNHIEIELPKQGLHTGKTFVFTGGQPEGKEYWKDAVESEGGVVKTSVSKTTDYVVVGADPGSKFDKAKQFASEGHGIKIIEDHSELKRMFPGF